MQCSLKQGYLALHLVFGRSPVHYRETLPGFPFICQSLVSYVFCFVFWFIFVSFVFGSRSVLFFFNLFVFYCFLCFLFCFAEFFCWFPCFSSLTVLFFLLCSLFIPRFFPFRKLFIFYLKFLFIFFFISLSPPYPLFAFPSLSLTSFCSFP